MRLISIDYEIKIIISRNNFTKLSITLVRKLTNKKIQWIIRQLEKGTLPARIPNLQIRTGNPRKDYHNTLWTPNSPQYDLLSDVDASIDC